MAKKSKIFFGTIASRDKTADIAFNRWLNDNPNVEIISVQYNQARMGDHSIFVFYSDDPPAPQMPDWMPLQKLPYHPDDPFYTPTPTWEPNLFKEIYKPQN